MKRILVLTLLISLVLAFSSCTADYPEIAKKDYQLDRGDGISGYDCAYGLSELGEKLSALYEEDDNVINFGRDVVEAKVDFDDAMLLVGDKQSLPLRIFYYVMANEKTSILVNALNVDATGDAANVYWNTKYPDQNYTIVDKAYENGLAYCMDYLATFYAMEDYGFEETEDYLDTYENILSSFGNVAALEEYYAPYGIDEEYLKLLLRFQLAHIQFKGHLVDVEGVAYPTDEEAYEYFQTKCVYMQQIVFPYVEVDELNRWVLKSEEEKLAAKERGQAIYAEIEGDNEMFIRNMDQSELRNWRDYIQGYFYAPYEIQQELLDAYYGLEVGEITAVDTPIGYYIIRACEKNQSVYKLVEDRILQALCDEIYKEILKPYYKNFTLDEAQYKRYSFEDIITFN